MTSDKAARLFRNIRDQLEFVEARVAQLEVDIKRIREFILAAAEKAEECPAPPRAEGE